MRNPQSLHTVRLTAPQFQFDALEEAFADQALAVTVLEDPQGPTLEILLPEAPDPNAIRARIAQILPDSAAQIGIEIEPVGNLDWIKEVSAQFEPLPIARWTIFGAAFKDRVPLDTLGLQIDATSAFGTGEHPTTRGCLLMLDRMLRRYPRLTGGRMLDMGCGSAILAMAYVKAAGGSALGIDMDEPSVTIAQGNLAANALAQSVRVECGCGYAPPSVAAQAPYDLIMANVFADPLCEMAGDLAVHLRQGGVAILSGILNHQAPAVIQAHRQQGLKLLHRMRIGAWSVLALRRPKRAS